MICRTFTAGDIPLSRRLWKERFGDSERFLDWYYAERFLPGSSFGLFDGSMLLSQVHCRPMTLRIGKRLFRALMIGGVSTGKQFEKRGCMHTVLHAVEQYAIENGFDLLFLATENPPIYLSSGFSVCAGALYAEGASSRESCTITAFEASMTARLTVFYNSVSKAYAFSPERTEAEMLSRARELCSDGAEIILNETDGVLTGYAFYNPDTHTCEEAFAPDDDAYRALLSVIPKGASVMLPPGIPVEGETVPLSMWKPLTETARLAFVPGMPAFCPETF